MQPIWLTDFLDRFTFTSRRNKNISFLKCNAENYFEYKCESAFQKDTTLEFCNCPFVLISMLLSKKQILFTMIEIKKNVGSLLFIRQKDYKVKK